MSQATAIDATFSALADPTRRAVIELLREQPQRAGQLAASLGISAPALSRHLRVLRRRGLITDDEPLEDARVRLYRLCPEAFLPLRDWLSHLEQFWEGQLMGFAAHVEAKKRGRR
jgi:DNA-binding transcriptional ArsR family regulator